MAISLHEAPVGDHRGPDRTDVDESELQSYVRAPRLLRLLRLEEPYFRLLREQFVPEVVHAESVARELLPDDTDAPEKLRGAILGIGGYQVWEDVRRDGIVVDRLSIAGIFFVVSGALVGARLHFQATSFPSALLYFFIALITAGVVALCGAVAAFDLEYPSSQKVRIVIGTLFLGGLAAAGWLLRDWAGVWGSALSGGLMVALVALAFLAVVVNVFRVATALAYRYTWAKYTVDNIVETLSAASLWLTGDNSSMRPSVALQIDHVADCVEQRLPQYFGLKNALRDVVNQSTAEMAVALRLLALDCLIPARSQSDKVLQTSSQLILAAVQGRWGDFPRADLPDQSRKVRLGAALWGAGRFVLATFPIVAVAAGALYFYCTDPSSGLLKTEVIVPLAVAALTFLATLLTGNFPSPNPEGPSGRTRLSRG